MFAKEAVTEVKIDDNCDVLRYFITHAAFRSISSPMASRQGRNLISIRLPMTAAGRSRRGRRRR
jgi:hypothetical protein